MVMKYNVVSNAENTEKPCDVDRSAHEKKRDTEMPY
jgi:hypothetical protein